MQVSRSRGSFVELWSIYPCEGILVSLTCLQNAHVLPASPISMRHRFWYVTLHLAVHSKTVSSWASDFSLGVCLSDSVPALETDTTPRACFLWVPLSCILWKPLSARVSNPSVFILLLSLSLLSLCDTELHRRVSYELRCWVPVDVRSVREFCSSVFFCFLLLDRRTSLLVFHCILYISVWYSGKAALRAPMDVGL